MKTVFCFNHNHIDKRLPRVRNTLVFRCQVAETNTYLVVSKDTDVGETFVAEEQARLYAAVTGGQVFALDHHIDKPVYEALPATDKSLDKPLEV